MRTHSLWIQLVSLLLILLIPVQNQATDTPSPDSYLLAYHLKLSLDDEDYSLQEHGKLIKANETFKLPSYKTQVAYHDVVFSIRDDAKNNKTLLIRLVRKPKSDSDTATIRYSNEVRFNLDAPVELASHQQDLSLDLAFFISKN